MTKLERGLIAVVVLLLLTLAWVKVEHARPVSAAEPLVNALGREGATRTRVQAATSTPGPTQAQGVDLAGRFVTHAEHIQPGMVKAPNGLVLRNPYAGNANAVATGSKLFLSYNCIDCHGADGSGAMGPSLADGRWHFGGTEAELFESIYEGRPEGMPAWGSLIQPEQIWMLVTYVQTLQNGKNVTTEDFTGKTIERTGH
jgi:cbb3-type cytochrome c oxidase subunit III